VLTFFYVDAFNLYFGSCRGTPYNEFFKLTPPLSAHSPVGIGKKPISTHPAGRPGHVLEASVLVTYTLRHGLSVFLLEAGALAQGLYGAALGEGRAALGKLADVHTALGGAEKDGGNGVAGRNVAVKEYDVFGHEVNGRRRLGPLRRLPMTLGSDQA